MKKNIKHRTLFFLLLVLLITLSILSMSMGDVDIPFFETYKIALKNLLETFGLNYNFSSTNELIVRNIRLPRILSAVFVGAGLGAVGCSYQGVFRNPMADPYVLGVSSGATLGATIMIITENNSSFKGLTLVALGAFIGAAITTVAVYLIASRKKKVETSTLLLSGVALSYLISAVVSLIIVFNEKNVSRIIFWTMGNLSASGYKQLQIIAPSIIAGCMVLLFFSRQLDILSTSEDVAVTLGINTDSLKKKIMLISSFIVAVCVSFNGIIGFVGLMVPHIMRTIVGPSHRKLLPFSMVGGSLFLLISDTLARSIVDSAELPVGAVTALFGAPFFIYLLIMRKRGR